MKVLGTLVAVAFAGMAWAQQPNLEIQALRALGNGCPPGTFSYNIATDGSALTMMYGAFVAAADGRATGVWYDRKSCDVFVRVRTAPGWSFAVDSLDYRGYLHLERGAEAIQTSTFYFPPHVASEPTATVRYTEPHRDDYLRQNAVPSAAQLWSDCGRTSHEIRITTQIAVRTRGDAGVLMTVDSHDQTYQERYQLQWRPCP